MRGRRSFWGQDDNTFHPPWSWLEAPCLENLRHPFSPEDHGRGPHVDLSGGGYGRDLVEGPFHDGRKARIHLCLVPEEPLEVLHPFEVRDDYTAGVGEYVGADDDALWG